MLSRKFLKLDVRKWYLHLPGHQLQRFDPRKACLPHLYTHVVAIMRGYIATTAPLMQSSRGGVNLVPSIPSDALESIQSLPEASQALDTLSQDRKQLDIQTIGSLKRASEIFEQFAPEGKEIKAILLLQSQAFSELELYSDSIKILDSLLKMKLNEEQFFDVSLAKIKMLWLDGSFEDAIERAQELCDFAPHMTSLNVQLYQGVALNALAICRLSSLDFKDVDMISVRKSKGEEMDSSPQLNQLQEAEEAKAMLKMASAILRNAYEQERSRQNPRRGQLALAAAASFANQGVAELMAIVIKSQLMGMQLPYDQALNACREALNVMDKVDNEISEKQATFLKATRARVYSNMTWAILFTSSYIDAGSGKNTLSEESLKIASKYAGYALKIHDEMNKDNGGEKDDKYHSMSRALSLVASCYARAGSAVTAEGLFHSAVDNGGTSSNPLCMLDARSSLVYYSQLCGNWEKRGADRDMNENLAIEKDVELSSPWRGKSSLYSGAFFISLGDL